MATPTKVAAVPLSNTKRRSSIPTATVVAQVISPERHEAGDLHAVESTQPAASAIKNGAAVTSTSRPVWASSWFCRPTRTKTKTPSTSRLSHCVGLGRRLTCSSGESCGSPRSAPSSGCRPGDWLEVDWLEVGRFTSSRACRGVNLERRNGHCNAIEDRRAAWNIKVGVPCPRQQIGIDPCL
jgi:hypothetical protein